MFQQRSPLERAVLALIEPHLFGAEAEFLEKNAFRMTFQEFDWRLNDLELAAVAAVIAVEAQAGSGIRHQAGSREQGSRLESESRHRYGHRAKGPGGDSMDLKLAGKVAVVTGGSRGLGFASARSLAAEGCHVAICARGAERLEEAAKSSAWCRTGGADVVPVQPTCEAGGRDAASSTRRSTRFGGLDILVNNVGLGRGGSLEETSDDAWHEALDQTLFPAIRASRAALPHLRRRGGGAIVIISSIFGREAGGRMTYNVVKAAEISLGKSLAQQLARDGIRVVTIAPGSILFPGGSWHARQQADPAGHRRVRQTRVAIRSVRPSR